MEALPYEVVLVIASYLDPISLIHLQRVSSHYLTVGRDSNLWRLQCFERSYFAVKLRLRAFTNALPPVAPITAPITLAALSPSPEADANRLPSMNTAQEIVVPNNERTRILANWDPSYVSEKIDWYSEFIQREAPIAINWLQQPRNRASAEKEALEVRGLENFQSGGKSFAVAPLDDGSVCLWDVGKCQEAGDKRGRIVGKSAEGILVEESKHSQKLVHSGVVECVKVDNERQRAYVAVRNDLVEIDLHTLQTISRESFPFSISALSEVKGSAPITVGTNESLHLYDPRASRTHTTGSVDQVEPISLLSICRAQTFRDVINPEPTPDYAPLFHPGPLSILHMPISPDNWDGNGEIYVAGRFPSILNYDRRYFPKLRGTLHSGARLCSMTHMPFSFNAQDKDLMRNGLLSIDQVYHSKQQPGNTLIACGEYNSKGSLEFYGLSPLPHLTTLSTDSASTQSPISVLRNRQTTASSKLLSVVTHGTRLVFSDGGGNIKWVERDGFTEVRRCQVGHGSLEGPRGIFGTLGDSYMDSGSGDIVRKLLRATPAPQRENVAVNDDDLLLWTGEKIGLLSFSSEPGFTADSFEAVTKSPEDARKERQEKVYSETMRRALERQADEVRFVRGLGLGLGFGRE